MKKRRPINLHNFIVSIIYYRRGTGKKIRDKALGTRRWTHDP